MKTIITEEIAATATDAFLRHIDQTAPQGYLNHEWRGSVKAALDAVADDIVSAFINNGGAFLQTVSHLKKEDAAVLIVIPHDAKGSSVTVESGDDQLALFKVHIERMLDREYERIGYNPERGCLRIERVIKGAISQWKAQYIEDGGIQ